MNAEERSKLGYAVYVKTRVMLDTELALGYLRYEALRKLNAREHAELKKRNLAGENFDDMVYDLILKGNVK